NRTRRPAKRPFRHADSHSCISSERIDEHFDPPAKTPRQTQTLRIKTKHRIRQIPSVCRKEFLFPGINQESAVASCTEKSELFQARRQVPRDIILAINGPPHAKRLVALRNLDQLCNHMSGWLLFSKPPLTNSQVPVLVTFLENQILTVSPVHCELLVLSFEVSPRLCR